MTQHPPEPSPLMLALRALRADPHDNAAWDTFYRMTKGFAVAVLLRSTVLPYDRAVIEDRLQEVYTRLFLYPRFTMIEQETDLRRYLGTVCRHVAFESLGHDPLFRLNRVPGDVQDLRLPSAEVLEEDRDAVEAFAETLGGLQCDEKELLGLLIKGYKIKEIAETRSAPIGTVAVQISRLRAKIRDRIKERRLRFM